MATQLWPSTLPVNPANYSEQKQPVTIHSQPDSGPRKSRRRFTKPVVKGQAEYLMTNEQAVILDNFWEDTMDAGAQKVWFLHPWRNVYVEARIPEAPTFAAEGPLAVTVRFTIEFLMP